MKFPAVGIGILNLSQFVTRAQSGLLNYSSGAFNRRCLMAAGHETGAQGATREGGEGMRRSLIWYVFEEKAIKGDIASIKRLANVSVKAVKRAFDASNTKDVYIPLITMVFGPPLLAYLVFSIFGLYGY